MVQLRWHLCHLYRKFELLNPLVMKKITLLTLSFGLALCINAQQTHNEHDGHNHGNTAPATTVNAADELLKFNVSEYDFGKIAQHKPVYYSFKITNTGKTPLKLDNVQASCGCTTPEWSREPIAPGATADIKVGYNAAAEGPFDKSITVTYNTSQSKQIRIKGTVWKAPDGPAPSNASVNFLKQQSF